MRLLSIPIKAEKSQYVGFEILRQCYGIGNTIFNCLQ